MRQNIEEKDNYVRLEKYDIYFKKNISFLNCLFFSMKASFTISFTKKVPVSNKKFQTELTPELMKYKENMELEFKNRSAEWVKSEISIMTPYGEIREKAIAVKKRYLNQWNRTQRVIKECEKVNKIGNIEQNENDLNYLRLFVSFLILGVILLALGITFLCLDILFKQALIITIIGSILPLVYLIPVLVIAKALQKVIREEKNLVQLEKPQIPKGFSLSDDIIPVLKQKVGMPTEENLNCNEDIVDKKVDTNGKNRDDAFAEFDRKIDAEIKRVLDEKRLEVKIKPLQNDQLTNQNFDLEIDDDDLEDKAK